MVALLIRDVVAANLCLGCGACAIGHGGTSAMTISDDGFLRPRPGTSAMQRADAHQICPGVDLSPGAKRPAYDPLWGPIIQVSTGFSNDANVRFMGSSGGVLSTIAISLIESGVVAFVWHTRADPHDPIGNSTCPSRTRGEILAAAGSRYGPSSPLAGLDGALATGETFAFIGKPCDVAALRKLAVLDARINRQIPYMLSFFCAGVPSREATKDVLAALNTRLENVRVFRYRGEGWPGLARVTRHDGSTETMGYNASWGTILNRKLQFRCKICPDGTGESADIVCADAWFGKDGYPDFDEREGRSLIVIRTTAGADLFAAAVASGALSATPLEVAAIEAMQPYQANRKRNVLARTLALTVRGRLAPRYRNFGLYALAWRANWGEQLRNFLGTLKRLR